jgi:hypothetical protein
MLFQTILLWSFIVILALFSLFSMTRNRFFLSPKKGRFCSFGDKSLHLVTLVGG